MNDTKLRVATKADIPELTRWIVGISHDAQRHCLHSWANGTAEELSDQLSGYLDDGELNYIAAFQGKRLVGAMGAEYDEDLGRAWLHGPHAFDDSWETLTPALYRRLMLELPTSLHKFDAYLNAANQRGREFYLARGFQQRQAYSYDYTLTNESRIASYEPPCPSWQVEQEASFITLYQELFPEAYYSANRVLQMIGASHQVFVIAQGSSVLGFVVASVEAGPSNGEVQFLGVHSSYRRRGYGKRLLLTATDWLFDQVGVSVVTLNVKQVREDARRLYESVGFRLAYTGVSFFKKLMEDGHD